MWDDQHGHVVEVIHRDRRDEDAVAVSSVLSPSPSCATARRPCSSPSTNAARPASRPGTTHAYDCPVPWATSWGTAKRPRMSSPATASSPASPDESRRRPRSHGPGRTVDRNAGYGRRLLAGIGFRALSPAPNDPTTTVLAQDRTEDGLLRLAGRSLGPTWLLDHAGRPQDHVPQPQWVDIVSLAVDETVPYGARAPAERAAAQRPVVRPLAAVPPDRRDSGVERQEDVGCLSAAALSALCCAKSPPVGPAGTGRTERTRHRNKCPSVKVSTRRLT